MEEALEIIRKWEEEGGKRELNLSWLKLSSLPPLPHSLQTLYCSGNQLTSLPLLPPSIQRLCCSNNRLTSLSSLPPSIQELSCGSNRLTSLPLLPSTLQELDCDINQLTSLPSTLPSSLQILSCKYNKLTYLPSTLPSSLQKLSCSYNQLTSLPPLPSSLQKLSCGVNRLTSLPLPPPSLQSLDCGDNEHLPYKYLEYYQEKLKFPPSPREEENKVAMATLKLKFPHMQQKTKVINGYTFIVDDQKRFVDPKHKLIFDPKQNKVIGRVDNGLRTWRRITEEQEKFCDQQGWNYIGKKRTREVEDSESEDDETDVDEPPPAPKKSSPTPHITQMKPVALFNSVESTQICSIADEKSKTIAKQIVLSVVGDNRFFRTEEVTLHIYQHVSQFRQRYPSSQFKLSQLKLESSLLEKKIFFLFFSPTAEFQLLCLEMMDDFRTHISQYLWENYQK